jgi:hypothetical protein
VSWENEQGNGTGAPRHRRTWAEKMGRSPISANLLGCCSSKLRKIVILSEAPHRFIVDTALDARSRRTPGVLILSMLFGAFLPPKPENRIRPAIRTWMSRVHPHVLDEAPSSSFISLSCGLFINSKDLVSRDRLHLLLNPARPGNLHQPSLLRRPQPKMSPLVTRR